MKTNEGHRFSRHYTVAEARALLPQIRRWLVELRRHSRTVERGDERCAPLLAEGRDLGGARVEDQLRAFSQLQAIARELKAREIQIKDLERGLVDFPSLRGDREVFLCWREGEDDIEFWHDLESGYPGREPI